MKKRIVAVILAAVALLCSCMSASAEGYKIGYETSFNAETGFVELSLFIDNAVGVQVADLCIGYDEAMYTFDHVDVVATGEAVAGKSQLADGLVTCSLMVMEELGEESVDENGRLSLAVYYFTPVGENYDTEEFFLWAKSFGVNEVDIVESINTQGNPVLMEDRSQDVTTPEIKQEQANNNTAGTTKKNTEGVKGNLSSKWYVYVIGAVLAIGAIAGIAMVVIKSNHNENEETETEESASETENE